MKWDKLLKLVLEETVEDYESWDDYLDWEADLSKEDLINMKNKFGCSIVAKLNNKILVVSDDNKTMWLEWDGDVANVWASDKDDVNSNLYRMTDSDLMDLIGVEEDDIYFGAWECSWGDAKEHPGTVYHYTTEEKWEEIQEDGGLKPSYGTGLTNRSASGIFTSIDSETYADGSYGDICLAIDLSRFKEDNKIEKLNISPEPEVLEVELQSLIRNHLDLEGYENEASQDMSPFTMIVNHYIPIKYVSVIG